MRPEGVCWRAALVSRLQTFFATEDHVMANSLIHWELMVNDVDKARAFYSRVFDWRFDDASFPGYTGIDTGATPRGGLMARPPGSPSTGLNSYFLVDDIDRTLRNVVEAGGTVIVKRTEIPPGWFAMFLDPDQIPIGILQEKPT